LAPFAQNHMGRKEVVGGPGSVKGTPPPKGQSSVQLIVSVTRYVPSGRKAVARAAAAASKADWRAWVASVAPVGSACHGAAVTL
jgi:hypothetical protein